MRAEKIVEQAFRLPGLSHARRNGAGARGEGSWEQPVLQREDSAALKWRITENGSCSQQNGAHADAAAVRMAFARVCCWRMPPHWSKHDWLDEVRAILHCAAASAGLDFDEERAVPLRAHIYMRAVAAVWTRYRQEWSYFLHCALESRTGVESIAMPFDRAQAHETIQHFLGHARNCLAVEDQLLIEQLFWNRTREERVAAMLEVSQSFVVDGPYSFTGSASAGNLTSYTANGGGGISDPPGTIVFKDSSKAASATLTANGGTLPGTIQFLGSSTGGTSRIVVNGGTFDISSHAAPGVTVGSIEGTSGFAILNGNKLTVGGNGMTTSFTGEILDTLLTSNRADSTGGTPSVASQDGTAPVPPRNDSPLAGGSLAKVGTGTLTLGGANTYTGGTTVSAGALILQQNGQSSQTGTGNVVVSAGTLGGDGNVTIGNNTGPRTILAPSFPKEVLTGLLTAGRKLTFRSDGDFVCKVNADNVTADKVNARGVAISAGSTFSLTQVGTGQMQIGTTFILINNTANTPISGTFDGVPEGAEIAFGNYLWKFTYLGGTGNEFSGEIVDQLSP